MGENELLDHEKLIKYGLDSTVAAKLDEIFKSGKLAFVDLDERALDALKEFPVDGALVVLSQFLESNLEHVSNKSAYLCGVMKTYRQKSRASNSSNGSGGNTRGPNEERIRSILDRTGYTLDVTTGQRKYGGPPPNWEGPAPGNGCEVFCGKIPKEKFEDELIPLFESCGTIWDLRLMMDPLTGTNRGYAFVTFTSREAAQQAVKDLDNYELAPGKTLKINISVPNLRLFVGNIPKSKSKEEIFDEFGKLTSGLIEVIIYSSPDDKKKNRGFCFLEYETHKSASLAKRRLGTGRIKVWGCNIIVDWADPQEEPDEQTMSKVKVLYVRNLTQEVTEEQLKIAFEQYGRVERVKKIKDYAFIHFEERENALDAMEQLNGIEMCGANIETTLAKPPSDKKKKEEILRARERRMMQMMQLRNNLSASSTTRGVSTARSTSNGVGNSVNRGEYDYDYDYYGYGEYRGGYNEPYYNDYYRYDDYYYDYPGPSNSNQQNRNQNQDTDHDDVNFEQYRQDSRTNERYESEFNPEQKMNGPTSSQRSRSSDGPKVFRRSDSGHTLNYDQNVRGRQTFEQGSKSLQRSQSNYEQRIQLRPRSKSVQRRHSNCELKVHFEDDYYPGAGEKPKFRPRSKSLQRSSQSSQEQKVCYRRESNDIHVSYERSKSKEFNERSKYDQKSQSNQDEETSSYQDDNIDDQESKPVSQVNHKNISKNPLESNEDQDFRKELDVKKESRSSERSHANYKQKSYQNENYNQEYYEKSRPKSSYEKSSYQYDSNYSNRRYDQKLNEGSKYKSGSSYEQRSNYGQRSQYGYRSGYYQENYAHSRYYDEEQNHPSTSTYKKPEFNLAPEDKQDTTCVSESNSEEITPELMYPPESKNEQASDCIEEPIVDADLSYKEDATLEEETRVIDESIPQQVSHLGSEPILEQELSPELEANQKNEGNIEPEQETENDVEPEDKVEPAKESESEVKPEEELDSEEKPEEESDSEVKLEEELGSEVKPEEELDSEHESIIEQIATLEQPEDPEQEHIAVQSENLEQEVTPDEESVSKDGPNGSTFGQDNE